MERREMTKEQFLKKAKRMVFSDIRSCAANIEFFAKNALESDYLSDFGDRDYSQCMDIIQQRINQIENMISVGDLLYEYEFGIPEDKEDDE